MRYFFLRLVMDDELREGTWSIDCSLRDAEGVEVTARDLYSGEFWNGKSPLTIGLLEDGSPLAFDMIGLEVPLVVPSIYNVIKPLLPTTTQTIPTKVAYKSGHLDYITLNITAMPDCLDFARSDYVPWKPEEFKPWRNPLGKAFNYAAIFQDAVSNLHFFRLKNWGQNRLVVSDEVRSAFTGENVKYIRYEPIRVI